jgi:hypothetical protein
VSLVEGAVHADGFGCGGEIEDSLRDGEFAFRGSEAFVDVPCGEGLLYGVRVSESDVFVREPRDPAGDEKRILAPVEHPCEPVEGGVRVGAAHRLVEGRDEVVVPLLRLVVQRGAFLHRGRKRGCVDGAMEVLYLLDHVEQIPPVAVGHRDERLPGVLIERERRTDEFFSAADECPQSCLVEVLQDEHLAPRQERAVELEAGVLRRRADEHDRAVFNVGQKRVLLGAVETVDLVDEKQGPLPDLAAVFRRQEHFPEVGHSGERRRKRFKREIGLLGEEPGDGRLPAPGRTPQHHRHEP